MSIQWPEKSNTDTKLWTLHQFSINKLRQPRGVGGTISFIYTVERFSQKELA